MILMGLEILIGSVMLVIIFCLLALGFWLVARGISEKADAPYVPTSRSMLPIIAEALDIQPGDIVYDLGSGDGRVLFYCAKRYPNASFIGLETNPLLLTYANLLKALTSAHNVSFRAESIATANYTDATRIYAYLLPNVLKALRLKLNAPRIATRAFEIPGKHPAKVAELSKTVQEWNKHLLYIYTE